MVFVPGTRRNAKGSFAWAVVFSTIFLIASVVISIITVNIASEGAERSVLLVFLVAGGLNSLAMVVFTAIAAYHAALLRLVKDEESEN